jgi:diadenosine tetraphosphatase ApaH/serine/threonine PP2A family protein phosphatase
MRFAILSDIHGNWEALRAVAGDIARSNVDEILCLGDSIGYGPDPGRCLDWVREHCVSLLGNAEEAALFDPATGGEAASAMMQWTRAMLGISSAISAGDDRRPALADENVGRDRLRYLEELPRVAWRAEALLVHASPRNPLHEYLLPGCVDTAPGFESLFRLFPRWAFVGHTHVAGVFTDERRFMSASAVPEFTLAGRQALVNVGSVGQPRDGDRRASYVLWEGDRVVFRRLEYDMPTFLAKTRLHPELASPQSEQWFRAAT